MPKTARDRDIKNLSSTRSASVEAVARSQVFGGLGGHAICRWALRRPCPRQCRDPLVESAASLSAGWQWRVLRVVVACERIGIQVRSSHPTDWHFLRKGGRMPSLGNHPRNSICRTPSTGGPGGQCCQLCPPQVLEDTQDQGGYHRQVH